MSDSRRRYRAIKEGLMQLYPKQPSGRLAQSLAVLAMFISGIVGSKSTHMRQVAKQAGPGAKVESRVKRLERWYRHEGHSYDVHYLPFIEPLLAHLAQHTLVLTIDGSEVGRGCMTMMVSLIYQRRAIPLLWTVVDRPKGHLAAQEHIALLQQLLPILPEKADVVVLGDGEFDSVELQRFLTDQGWDYVCRTAKDTLVYCQGTWQRLDDLALPDLCLSLPDVAFTEQAYGPVTVVVWWERAYAQPVYLVTSLCLAEEACYWYRRRMRIETFFSDQKSRGFHLDKSHLSDPQRLSRLLMAACLAYIWIIYLGVHAHGHGWVPVIHRSDRCDLSLFQIGLDLLDHFLNEELAIPVNFYLPSAFLFA